MKTNEKKKVSLLEAAELPMTVYRAGFRIRIKAVIPGVARGSVGISGSNGPPGH